MNRKKISKIGLSLLVAALFIFSAVNVIATSVVKEKGDASDRSETTQVSDMIKMPSDDPIAQEDPYCGVYVQGLAGIPAGGMITPGTYNLDVGLWYDPTCYAMYGPPIVKVFTEVYQHQCGADVLMYETSFEDNFDIYNNWMQVDKDCGVDKEGNPGFFDTWTWTDARANCGTEHSMKCTMYDVYKGNQDDYLECTKSFDISEQQGIRIDFDIWVEGDYDEFWAMGFYNPLTGYTTTESLYTVFDYLDFEVGDEYGNWMNPDNFYNGMALQDDPSTPSADETDYMIFAGASQDYLYEGAYKFPDTSMPMYQPSPYENYVPKVTDKGNGWWTVTWYCDTWWLAAIGLDVTDIQFRFSWHSDPEQQFEGAYVDCVKVYSRETYKVKVHQSHTQGPVVLDPANPDIFYDTTCGNFYVRLPLPWDAEFIEQCGAKETGYQLWVWVEVLNSPCTYWTPYDWPYYADIDVLVGEWSSCEVANLVIETSIGHQTIVPGSGVIETGDDAHIMADVHVCGITPMENIQVNAYAEKVYWETLYETSFDNAMGWEFGEFAGLPEGSLWHISDFTSWDSGGKSLACNLKTTNHYIDNMYYDYALSSATFDITDKKALVLDYYYKIITADSGDYYRLLLQDPAMNYILSSYPEGISGFYSTTNPRQGYFPDWIGPEEPRCRYGSANLLAMYNYWHDIRFMFRNADGSQETEFGIGFAFFSSATGYVSAQAEADGVWWSGLFIDELKVRGELVGDKVWEDAMIIPGPVEPCETVPVQFEWEDVPACNYKITIECESGCGNCGDKEVFAQILSVTTVEVADYKEMETFDYTGGGGPWCISTSDTDNYLATNCDSTTYEPDLDILANLCPDHAGDCGVDSGEPCCIDISHLTLAPGELMLDMDMWWDVEGFGYDYCYLEIAPCGETFATDWIQLLGWGNYDPFPEASWYYNMNPDSMDSDWVKLSDAVCPNAQWAYTVQGDVDWWMSVLNPGYIPQPGGLDLGQMLAFYGLTGEFQLRFRFTSDPGFNFRGMKFDDLTITNLLVSDVFPYVVGDLVDPMDDMSNWCTGVYSVGNYWQYNPLTGEWCVTWPAGVDIDNAIVWTTEIEDVFEAYFTFETMYDFGSCSSGVVQIREIGGEWRTLYVFTGTSSLYPLYELMALHTDITAYAGKTIQIRFIVDGDCGGVWCIRNLQITGKKDETAPTSAITMSGTMKDSGWYSTAVKIKITADDTGSGVKEIHYILDGVEKVVPGAVAEFTISGNGIHTLEYWAVDNLGNEEIHHTVPSFKIDSGVAPTVAITAPEPGIYLFGKKILSSSNVFIIGAFTIEATANDVDSGIYKLSFYLDDQLLGEDTEAPFSQYVALRHMGAGTIKVVAEDFAQNVADDTLALKYYKFF